MLLSDIKLHLDNIFLRLSSPQKVFNDIYQQKLWGDSPSVSGSGSDTSQTKSISLAIPKLIKKYQVETMLDAPCGDFYWLKNVELSLKKYIGADIVPSIISQNIKLYSDKKRQFINCNIIVDKLPRVDLILCRDCLVHFSTTDIQKTIKNFQKSGATYLLTTIFPQHPKNPNIPTGRWRPIDLCSPPFNFPKPTELITEKCTEINGEFSDKSLGLWKLSDLSSF